MHKTSRRSLLKALLALSCPPALTSYGAVASAAPRTPEYGDAFDQFLRLSRVLTRTHDLDATVATKIFQMIADEPYGIGHVREIHASLADLPHGPDGQIQIDPADYTEGKQWFISHLLITWYTGVYFHSRGNQYVSLKHALMYEKLAEFRAPPTFCSGQPGAWALPPDVAAA